MDREVLNASSLAERTKVRSVGRVGGTKERTGISSRVRSACTPHIELSMLGAGAHRFCFFFRHLGMLIPSEKNAGEGINTSQNRLSTLIEPSPQIVVPLAC